MRDIKKYLAMTMQSPPDEQITAGRIAQGAVALAKELCSSAMDGSKLDAIVEEYIRDEGGEPALKGYHPKFASKPYEWTTCIAVDNEVVHGVPVKPLDPNHLITIDLVVRYKDWHADTARTFTYSDDPLKQQFVKASSLIFEMAKDAITPRQPISLFGTMVQQCAEQQGYAVIKEYCGHGIGKAIHTDPQILNYYAPSTEVFQIGQAYAVEPILAIESTYSLKHHPNDGFTVIANRLVTHNEDTIFISDSGAINLTGNNHE
jgi:methionyl aminopeptidase